jgi:hypothetical protein
MTTSTYVIGFAALLFWGAGEFIPLVQLRSRGLRLPFLEFSSPMIRKSILAVKHNKKIFDALQTIRDNNLEISFRDLEKMYNSNVNFQNVIEAYLLIKTRDINISKVDLQELTYTSKDLLAVVSAKNPGDEIRFDVFSNKRSVLNN